MGIVRNLAHGNLGKAGVSAVTAAVGGVVALGSKMMIAISDYKSPEAGSSGKSVPDTL